MDNSELQPSWLARRLLMLSQLHSSRVSILAPSNKSHNMSGGSLSSSVAESVQRQVGHATAVAAEAVTSGAWAYPLLVSVSFPSRWLLAADLAGSRASLIFLVVSIRPRGVSSSTRPLPRSTNPSRAVQGRRLVHSRACCVVLLRLPAAGGCPRVCLWSSWSVLSFSPGSFLPLPLKSDSSLCSRCAIGPGRSLCGHQLPGAVFPIRHSWDGSV
jgi:hypothetical protein